MKKVMTMVLLVTLLAGLLIQPVAAAGMQASISASAQTVKAGDSVNFTVSVSSDAECDQFGLQLSFDQEVFEIVSGVCTVSMTDDLGIDKVALKVFDKNRGFAVSFSETVIYSGRVGTFTLKVKDDAPAGSYSVGFQKTAANLGAGSVPFGSASTTITVEGETVEPTEIPTEAPTEAPTEPKPTEHKHTYSNKWSSDKNEHWHECTGCGDKKDVKKHTPGPEATETEHQRCKICNYVIKQALGHTHDYGKKWVYDDNKHWHVCECGDKSDVAAHTWGSNNVCTKCSAENNEQTQPEETTAPAETTQPTVETTEATQPAVQPNRPNYPQVRPTEPSEPAQEGLTDAQWGVGGLILAAVVVLAVVAYFFLAKKRQR